VTFFTGLMTHNTAILTAQAVKAEMFTCRVYNALLPAPHNSKTMHRHGHVSRHATVHTLCMTH